MDRRGLKRRVSNQIYDRRHAKHLSQRELAARIGATKNNVERWETGDCLPSAISLYLLADEFGCTVDDLMCRKLVRR